MCPGLEPVQMSSRPVKHIALRNKLFSHKDFILRINKSKSKSKLRSLIKEASDNEIRTLQNLVIAFFDKYPIEISVRNWQTLKRSGKVPFIKENFKPVRSLGTISAARSSILYILPVLKLFTKSVTAPPPSLGG